MALSASESSLTEEHQNLLTLIQVNHDEAYLYVSQGLSYQEQKQLDLARVKYEKGLEKIDKALSIKTDLDYCIGPKWDHARNLQDKMRNTAQMIRSQLHALPHQYPPVSPVYTPPEPLEMPPSYDEACGHELLSVHRRSSLPGSSSAVNGKDDCRRRSSEVVDLFCIPGDVLVFFISCDGSVSSTSSPSSLNIYQFVEVDSLTTPPAWLQIGNWTYPLLRGQSPVFESAYGAFLFPNIGVGRDSAVGVILPSSVSPEKRAEFLELLNNLTAFKEEKHTEPSSLKFAPPAAAAASAKASSISETISKGLVTGAEYLSAGIVKGASISSDLIHKGATKARQRISPDSQPVVVDPRVKEGLKIAHEASGVALKATGFLVSKLGELTLALGSHLAPHIQKHGTKLLTSTFNKDPKDAKDTVDGVLTVAAGGVQGFSTIYMGLENAAKTLAYSLSSETVNIVGHKYGDDVGQVVGNAVFSIGNLALTTHNVQSLGIKSVAKRTAKDAGKAVLKDYAKEAPEPKK